MRYEGLRVQHPAVVDVLARAQEHLAGKFEGVDGRRVTRPFRYIPGLQGLDLRVTNCAVPTIDNPTPDFDFDQVAATIWVPDPALPPKESAAFSIVRHRIVPEGVKMRHTIDTTFHRLWVNQGIEKDGENPEDVGRMEVEAGRTAVVINISTLDGSRDAVTTLPRPTQLKTVKDVPQLDRFLRRALDSLTLTEIPDLPDPDQK